MLSATDAMRRAGRCAKYRLSPLLLSACAVFYILSTAESSAADPLENRAIDAGAEKWAQVVAGREAYAAALESVQYELRSTFQYGTEEEPKETLHSKSTVVMEGDKVYVSSVSVVEDQPWEYSVAFDGVFAYRRLSEFPDIIFRTRNRDMAAPAIRLPHDVIEYISPEGYEERLRDDRSTLLSAEEVRIEDVDCIKAIWSTRGQKPGYIERQVVWYAINHNYLPIRTEIFNAEGERIRLREQIKFRRLIVDGNSLSYPIAGRTDILHKARSTGYWAFTVDPESLKINADIPGDQFVLKPLPGERIYDSDVGEFIEDEP